MAHNTSQKVFLQTPLGALSFSANCRIGTLENSKITVHKWQPPLPDGMTVSGCHVILFRYKPLAPLKDFIFSCDWDDLSIIGHGNSGEALEAWEWESDKNLVLVGTEDAELLHSRLKIDKEYLPGDYPITLDNNKISIKIDAFDKNQGLSLHYVVAWNTLPEPKECSCWFAVDVPHPKILDII